MNLLPPVLGSVLASALLACGGETSCFVSGTRVLTPRGLRTIEELAEGDEVVSFDPERGAIAVRRVREILHRTVRQVVRVRAGEISIAGVSPDHPFWDATTRTFRPVATLSLESRLSVLLPGTRTPRDLAVEEIAVVAGPPVEVWNLEVDGEEHTYFAEGILVHNKACGGDASGCGESSGAGGSGASGGASGSGGAGAGSGTTSGATTTGATGSGGETGSGGDGSGGGLSSLSDAFEGDTLDDAWSIFNPDVFDVTVADGALSLSMTTPALWFQAGNGALVHKLVRGDFRATAVVHARKNTDPEALPDVAVQLGGIMARDPAGTDQGGEENYVFIVVGRDEDDVSVETKSTTDSVSDYVGPSWPSGDAELRMCRLGSTFHLYKRGVGAGTWELATSYDRPDLPDELQVGMNAYTAVSPDLAVHFDELVFAEVTDQEGCEG